MSGPSPSARGATSCSRGIPSTRSSFNDRSPPMPPEDLNDNFEFFGKVRQQLQAKRSIGRDIVTLTDYMAARWVRDGFVEAIDKSNVPNAKNIVPELASINYDPKRNYTLPWQSGAIGLGYDRRKTGRKLTSIKDLFDPK